MQPGVTPGAILELHAGKAAGGVAPGTNGRRQWTDLSGNGNHGALSGFAWTEASGWSADRLTFDGVDDSVACPALGAVNDLTFAYEAWLQTTNKASSNHDVILEISAGRTAYSIITLYGSTLYYSIRDGTTTRSVSWYSPSLTNGALHHICGTCDGSLMRLWVDGVERGTPTTPPAVPIAPAATFIGSWATAARVFPGSIHAARAFPFALTPEQIAANYAAGLRWLSRRPSGLLVYQSGRSALSWH